MASQKRSPHYPFIPLRRAIERVGELRAQETRSAAPVSVAVGAWGYKPKSSGGIQTIAALKAFGLLEDEGSGDKRTVKLSEVAHRILLDTREDSGDRKTLIREAALRPKIIRRLWEQYKDEGLPSDPNLRHTLIFDYEFNENTVDDFIRIFKETLQFAGLDSSDTLAEPADRDGNGSDDDVPPPAQSSTNVRKEAKMQTATIPLAEGTVKLELPAVMSRKSYERLKSWLELMRSVAEDSVETGEGAKPTGSDSSG